MTSEAAFKNLWSLLVFLIFFFNYYFFVVLGFWIFKIIYFLLEAELDKDVFWEKTPPEEFRGELIWGFELITVCKPVFVSFLCNLCLALLWTSKCLCCHGINREKFPRQAWGSWFPGKPCWDSSPSPPWTWGRRTPFITRKHLKAGLIPMVLCDISGTSVSTQNVESFPEFPCVEALDLGRENCWSCVCTHPGSASGSQDGKQKLQSPEVTAGNNHQALDGSGAWMSLWSTKPPSRMACDRELSLSGELEVCRHCNLGTLWIQVSLGVCRSVITPLGRAPSSWALHGISYREAVHPAPAEPLVCLVLISLQVKVGLSLGFWNAFCPVGTRPCPQAEAGLPNMTPACLGCVWCSQGWAGQGTWDQGGSSGRIRFSSKDCWKALQVAHSFPSTS